MNGRPIGVTILALLAAVAGVVQFLGGLALLGLGFVAAGGNATGGLAGLATILGVLGLVLGIADIVLAYGLWTLKPWAWTLGVALAGIGLALIVVQAVLSSNIVNALVSSIVSIAIWVVVLYYLFTPRVRALFGRS